MDRTGLEPLVYFAQRAGTLITRHFPGLIQTGDCLAVIGTDLPRDEDAQDGSAAAVPLPRETASA